MPSIRGNTGAKVPFCPGTILPWLQFQHFFPAQKMVKIAATRSVFAPNSPKYSAMRRKQIC